MKTHRSVAKGRDGIAAGACMPAVSLLLLLLCLSLASLSCLDAGNATEAQKEELLQAVREYWENHRNYNPGTTSGVGEMTYAEVAGDEAKVRVEIILGYAQPTEGAGYKETTFLLRRDGDSWKITRDGFIGEEVRH